MSYVTGIILLFYTEQSLPTKKQTSSDLLHISESLVPPVLSRPEVPASVILLLPSARNQEQTVTCSLKQQTFTTNFVEIYKLFPR
jgi:hypothetical protein